MAKENMKNDTAQDKAMIKKAFKQHDAHTHTVIRSRATFFHALGMHPAFVTLDYLLSLGIGDLLYFFRVHHKLL